MPSPFPGMDPYLEGYLWPDVHHALAEEIRGQLAAKIRPHYVARIALRFVADEADGNGTVDVVLPDVEVLRGHRPAPVVTAARVAEQAITAAPLVLPAPRAIPVRLASVEIRDTANRQLVTSIEILSPVNKRGPGWQEYQGKRRTVIASQAHLLEIDLLRRGRRPIDEGELPDAPYFVFLTRAPSRQIEVWPISLPEKLPVLPVPLLEPDPDVPLELGAALTAIYERAGYDLDIDYGRAADPPLKGRDAEWADELLKR